MHRPPWPNRFSSAGHLENYKIAFCILSHNTSLACESQLVFKNVQLYLTNNKNAFVGSEEMAQTVLGIDIILKGGPDFLKLMNFQNSLKRLLTS